MFVSAADVAFEAYDVIIAGSGPAGVTVARKLESQGKRSLIIETGPLKYDRDIHYAHSNVYASGHYSATHWPHHWFRTFGGTSLVWVGWCAPLSERNLVNWPITSGDLVDYYREAAHILGRSTDFLSYQAPFISGFTLRPVSLENPLRVNEAYEKDFRTSRSSDVLLEASVTGLQANEGRNKITKFSLFNQEMGSREIALGDKQELVLAAGGLGNAQILLSSQAQGGVAIGNENDQVGRYLMEHPHFYNCARMVVSTDLALPSLPADFGTAKLSIIPEDPLYAQNGRLDASLTLTETELNADDSVERYVIRMLGGTASAYNITIRSEMPPDPENRVQLAEGYDPSGMPRLRVSCMVAGEAIRVAENYLRHIGTTLIQEGKGRLWIDNNVIYREVTGGGHTMGTTRMGDDPRSSVVDRNCRVHDYRNLSIAGSSVFPTGGYANPTLTIIALALRLADHLGETQ